MFPNPTTGRGAYRRPENCGREVYRLLAHPPGSESEIGGGFSCLRLVKNSIELVVVCRYKLINS
jgi:hypothetical protein